MQTQHDVPTYDKIMVVDDNKIDLYIVDIILKKNNFAREVLKMESGKAAMDYLLANKDYPENLPGLIFLDINMPGMNGFEFMEGYNDLPDGIKKDCIILMLTTSINSDDMTRAANNKFILKFMNKPLNTEKLWDVQEHIISHHD
jgi:CheY-like chemotaxis protein